MVKNIKPSLGSKAIPRGLLRWADKIILHKNLSFVSDEKKWKSDLRAHKSMISRVSSRKYQLCEAQSTAIWCTDLKEYISGIGMIQLFDKFAIFPHSIMFRLLLQSQGCLICRKMFVQANPNLGNSIFPFKYLVQLIEQPILRIPNFNFLNLRCCKVFSFFCVESYIGIFLCILVLI